MQGRKIGAHGWLCGHTAKTWHPKGVIFLTIEDETRHSNVIVMPDVYDRNRLLVARSKFLLVEGVLQNRDNVIHVKATRLMELSDRALEVQSHDFH
jgi:error-prone DNA polymerase